MGAFLIIIMEKDNNKLIYVYNMFDLMLKIGNFATFFA